MRKTSHILLLLLVLSALLVGCAPKGGLSIQICGYSDPCIRESPHNLEYKVWSKGTFTSHAVEKEITLSVGSLQVTGQYVESEHSYPDYYDTHIYTDENKHRFTVTDEGQLSAYFFGSDTSDAGDGRLCTESECVEIASAFVSAITDISEYTVTAVLDENRRIYTVSFRKNVDGFQCADQAEVWVEENGHIYSFSSTMLGKFPVDAVTDFNLEEIQKQVIAKLDRKYAKAKAAYDTVSYDNINYELTVDVRGQYVLICSVDVNCIRSQGEYDAITSERIQLRIQ